MKYEQYLFGVAFRIQPTDWLENTLDNYRGKAYLLKSLMSLAGFLLFFTESCHIHHKPFLSSSQLKTQWSYKMALIFQEGY